MRYQDFCIEFGPPDGKVFPVKVRGSPMGEEGQPQFFGIPFSDEELKAPLYDTKSTGIRLYDLLFKGQVGELFAQTLGRLEDLPQWGLRINICLNPVEPAVSCIAALPWEALFRQTTNEFLGLDRRVSIVRRLLVPRPAGPPRLPSRIRILVAISCPRGLNPIDSHAERQRIAAAVSHNPLVTLTFLEHATTANLRAKLRQCRRFHVLHFIGHGDFNADSRVGRLYFEDDRGYPDPINGEHLARLIQGSHSPLLVFLNACSTAQTTRMGHPSPFSGVAESLVFHGFPIVIAMRAPIRDDVAIGFSETFYDSLSGGRSIEEAMVEARLALLDSHGEDHWTVPQIFTRTGVSPRETAWRRWAGSVLGLGITLGSLWVGSRSNRALSIDHPDDRGIVGPQSEVSGMASTHKPFHYLFVQTPDGICYLQEPAPLIVDSTGIWHAEAHFAGAAGERELIVRASREKLPETPVGEAMQCPAPDEAEYVRRSILFSYR